MQTNDSGFKMSFKKRNPDFKKPPKKASATISAGGDLRKNDQPTKAMKKPEDSDSSSEEDILEQKRKAELENQKSEQAKLVEMALLEQVMNGKIDVLDLLKSGEGCSAKIKEKLQQQLLDGIPTSQPQLVAQKPAPHSSAQSVQSSLQSEKAAQLNPLMRNRIDSIPAIAPQSKEHPPARSSSKLKNMAKTTGAISSESSESSSESSVISGISSESDSDIDSHKLTKKVKKLKTKNKKLRKKVKTLKKKLKDKKSEAKEEKPASPEIPQQIPVTETQQTIMPAQPMIQPPLTPQQFAAKQAQLRRQYDPKTGQYREVFESQQPVPVQATVPLQQPQFPRFPQHIPGMMPPLPPMPYGQIPMVPPLPLPLAQLVTQPPTMPPHSDSDNITITDVKSGNNTTIQFLSDDDLYSDVFKGKEEKKPARQSQPAPVINPAELSAKVQQIAFNFTKSGDENAGNKGQQKHQIKQQQNENAQIDHPQFNHPPNTQNQPKAYQHPPQKEAVESHSLSEKPSQPSKKAKNIHEVISDESDSSQSDQEKPKSSRPRKDSKDVVVRSKAAKELVKDFYEDDQLAVMGEKKEAEDSKIKKNSTSIQARGVHYSGKCIFCNQYHTVTSKGDHVNLCAKGSMYKNKTRQCEVIVNKLRKTVTEGTEKMVSLKNKRALMTKLIEQNDVTKNERAQKMDVFRKYISGLPEPVKVSQEFGRKVVEAHNQQANLGNKLQAAISRGNSAARGDSQPRDVPPERGIPERGIPDRGIPESGIPERSIPERGIPERGNPDRGIPESGIPERGIPERGIPERGIPERGVPSERYIPPERDLPPERVYSSNPDSTPLVRRMRQSSESEYHQARRSPVIHEEYKFPRAASYGRNIQPDHQISPAQRAGPPLPSQMQGNLPAPPRPRSGLNNAPAAGPPQRPPPAALLRTPSTGGPLQRGGPPREEEYEDMRYQARSSQSQGWSTNQPR